MCHVRCGQYYLYTLVTYHLIFGLQGSNINTVMRYHVLYNDEKIIPNVSQNLGSWPIEYDLDKASVVLTWQLNDYPLTKKFIDLYKKVYQNAKQQDGGRFFQTSQMVLTSATEESILSSRVQHNEFLRRLHYISKRSSELSIDMSNDYFVNELDPYDRCVEKFNNAHYFFETEANKWEQKLWHLEQRGMRDFFLEVQELFRNINSTCHFNEQHIENEIKYVTILGVTYMSDSKKPNFVRYTEWQGTLKDDDYEHFQYNNQSPGTLYLDFATIGKALTEVACTNDIKLLKSKQVSQQITYSPCVRYTWEPPDDTLDVYNKWIEENNVSDYYDLSDAKFTPGLHVLGQNITHDFNTPQEFSDFIDNKKVVGTLITDDNNNSIL